MRILITGSSGQLGAEVARQLSTEHETIGIDVVPGEWTGHVMSITERDVVFAVVKDVDAVIHIASLHAPHTGEYSKQSFIDTNISGTLHLLEAAALVRVRRFVYTSTTSIYGFSMLPVDKAVWVTEELTPRPRDIYDITKIAAEELCRLFAHSAGIPVICLRTSRFYDQSAELLATYRLYRGVDVRDVAAAHVLAVTNSDIAFDIFNISARPPFLESDTPGLLRDAAPVLQHYYPNIATIFSQLGWKLPSSIDRVYVIAKAEQLLGYRPAYNFDRYIEELARTNA